MTESAQPKFNETIAKIKSHGFWEIVIRPLKFFENRLSLGNCKQLIEENQVRFRGWDYPHISSKYGIKSGIDWVENITDWSEHIEYWRMYKSAQFFHIFSLWEDWWGNVKIFWSQQSSTTPGYGLEFLCTLYTFTEIYELGARLAKKKIFDDGLHILITLTGMSGRRLVTTEINRSMLDFYVCNVDKIQLARKATIEEIIGKSKEMAINDTLSVFEHFNFFEPPRKVLEEEQDKLIKHFILGR